MPCRLALSNWCCDSKSKKLVSGQYQLVSFWRLGLLDLIRSNSSFIISEHPVDCHVYVSYGKLIMVLWSLTAKCAYIRYFGNSRSACTFIAFLGLVDQMSKYFHYKFSTACQWSDLWPSTARHRSLRTLNIFLGNTATCINFVQFSVSLCSKVHKSFQTYFCGYILVLRKIYITSLNYLLPSCWLK